MLTKSVGPETWEAESQALPPDPIKVLQLLVSLPVGGAEDLVAATLTGLDPERFRVQAACIGPLGAVGHELAARGHAVVSLGLNIKRTSTLRVAAAVRHLLKEMRPDILHTHIYHANFYGRLASLGLGLKGVVAAVHNTYTQPKLHRRLANFLLARVTDWVLVGSPQVWADVRRYDWVPAPRLLLLPYGIRLEEPASALSPEEAKARLGVSGFCVGAVGRLEEQKGHDYLLAAVSELRRQVDGLTVLLVGEGRQEEALRQQARDLGVADVVHFLGTRRDLPLIYRALDVYVQPSRWEGLSLAMLQAMGAALPVVVSRVGGALEVVQDRVNGRLVPVGDPQALATAVLELYRQPDQRRRLGERARRSVSKDYSQEAMLRKLASLYLELWARGRGR